MHDLGGVILGPIVNDKNFEIVDALIRNAVQGVSNPGGRVETRNDDGDHGSGSGGKGG